MKNGLIVVIFSVFVLLIAGCATTSTGNFNGYPYNENLRFTVTTSNQELPFQSYEDGSKASKKVTVGMTMEEVVALGFDKKYMKRVNNQSTVLYFKPHAGIKNTDLPPEIQKNISNYKGFYSYVCTWKQDGYFQTPSLVKYGAKLDRSYFRTTSYFVAYFAVEREVVGDKEVETIIFKDFSGQPIQTSHTTDTRKWGVLEIWLDKIANRIGDTAADEFSGWLREQY